MKSENIIPANSDKPCGCCSRIHRKLYLVDSLWLGKNCAEHYELYKRFPQEHAVVWQGYERQYTKIKRMVS